MATYDARYLSGYVFDTEKKWDRKPRAFIL